MNQHQFDLMARRFAAADRRALFRAALVAIAVNTFGGLGDRSSGRRSALAVAPKASSAPIAAA